MRGWARVVLVAVLLGVLGLPACMARHTPLLSRLAAEGRFHGLTDMHVAVVGSRPVEEDAMAEWGAESLRLFPGVRVYGFEADAEGCAHANARAASAAWSERHFPVALWNETLHDVRFHLTRNGACSSLLEPDEAMARTYGITWMEKVGEARVNTTTLDAWAREHAVPRVDLLKVDVQGAALPVLQGAADVLRHTLVVQVEVDFVPLYVGEHRFGRVDTFLAELGFALFGFVGPTTRIARKRAPLHRLGEGALLWADALYVRDWRHQPAATRGTWESADALFRLACLADVFGHSSFALETLQKITLSREGRARGSRFNFSAVVLELMRSTHAQPLPPTHAFHALQAELEATAARDALHAVDGEESVATQSQCLCPTGM